MSKKILVVDNHPVILKYMCGLLEREGHKVVTAPDGVSTLDILQTYEPEVIFLDLVMPNIGGEKLCRVIRSMPRLKDVYLVILSAIAAEEDLDLAELGADACIAKGRFNEMAVHVLEALAASETGRGPMIPKRKWGIDAVDQRFITKELLSSRRHLQVVLNNMCEAIFELIPESRIVYTNPSASDLVGVSEEALLASSFTLLFEEPHRERVEEVLRLTREGPQTIGTDAPLSLKGRQVTLQAFPITDETSKSAIIMLKDVTGRKRMESRLLEAKKMEAIGTLAGGVAHQFNNALFTIIGNIEMINMALPEGSELGRHIEPMKHSAQRMARLTAQLLAYARGGKYQAKTWSMGDFIRETLSLVDYSLDPSIHVETDLPPETWKVKMDLTQMQMVLSAVLANAAEALEGKGRIRITCRNRVLTEESCGRHGAGRSGPHVCLSVEDQGKGMDEEAKARIFDPFYTTKFEGRGLGMAAAYGIVRNHEGWIEVASAPGRGTTVEIYLPATEGKRSPDAASGEVDVEPGATILVVEDEETVLDVTRAMLERLHHRVLSAKTARSALALVKEFEGRIDLAILDVVLPDMEGKEIYLRLRELRPDMKVLLCSGHGLEGPVQEILGAGAEDFIQKPFSLEILSAKIETFLKDEKGPGPNPSTSGE